MWSVYRLWHSQAELSLLTQDCSGAMTGLVCTKDELVVSNHLLRIDLCLGLMCHTGALGDERHMLLECPALADLRDEFSPLIAECSGVMARLVWAQPMVSRYIIACLDRMS